MKKLFSLFGFVAFLCPLLIAQPEVSSNNVQDEIRYLEQQWLDAAAVPDLPALRKMFSDDFMGTVYPQTSTSSS